MDDDDLGWLSLASNPSVNFDRSLLYGDTGYGPGMTGAQTSTYDSLLNLTGSKTLADLAASSGNVSKLISGLSSAPGIAGLGGAALGLLDRAKPTGGGTTMAYPGAAQLERKMVQGPYGPLAEYTGVGGGKPDYTRFTAPKVDFPTVSPTPAPSPGSGMSVQAKVDLYKQLRGYGLSDERVRRIAETMFGTQTDSDWAELTRRAGASTEGGIKTPSPSPTPAPSSAARGTAAEQFAKIGKKMPTNWESTTDPVARINMLNSMGVNSDQLKSLGYSPADISWMESRGLGKTSGGAPKDEDISASVVVYGPDGTMYSSPAAARRAGATNYTLTPPSKTAPTSTPAPAPVFQVTQGSTPQAKANEYNRLRANMSDAEVRALADTAFGKQTDADWSYLKQIAGAGTATSAGSAAPGAVTTEPAAQGKTSDEVWDKNASTNLSYGKHEPTLATWRDPTSGAGVAVVADNQGRPGSLRYLSADGTVLNTTGFNASDLYANAEKLGMDLSNIGQLGAKLDAKKVGYKPYELYKGTGSDHGIDFQDIAQGGMGTAYDWTKDPLAHLKGPTGQRDVDADKALAEKLGLTLNPAVTTEQGIDPTKFTTLMAGDRPRSNVAFTGGTASWYDTPTQAQDYLNSVGGGHLYSTASGTPTLQNNTLNPAIDPTNRPLNEVQRGLTSAGSKADEYNRLRGTFGLSDEQIRNSASQIYGTQSQSDWDALVGMTNYAPAAAPAAAQPRDLTSLLPSDWGSYTGPDGAQKKIDWFNQQKATEAELKAAGVGQGDIDWMRQQKNGLGSFARGGIVQMEDGGFVMTKRAVDGAGGPPGIRSLLPDARMIRGPGTGTSDSIPAVINGRNGKTPARLSNGEAYVPPGRNTKGLYALMHQLERKA